MQLMKKFTILSALTIFVSLSVALLNGCQQQFTPAQSAPTPAPSYLLNADHSPTAEGKKAADDIIFTPGGLGYMANLHQEGEESIWPPIQVSEVVLGNNIDTIHIGYRAYIETKAGQVRNNIIDVSLRRSIPLPWMGMDIKDINLKVASLLPDMQIWQDLEWHGPGRGEKVLFIEVPERVKPGEYQFEIGIEVNGKDYGRAPCTIKVSE
jgi:hypothetical protein